MKSILDRVLTTTEICKKTGLKASTLRMRISKGNIPQRYYRKSDKGILFLEDYIDYVKKNG